DYKPDFLLWGALVYKSFVRNSGLLLNHVLGIPHMVLFCAGLLMCGGVCVCVCVCVFLFCCVHLLLIFSSGLLTFLHTCSVANQGGIPSTWFSNKPGSGEYSCYWV